MSNKLLRSIRKAQSFEEWLEQLKRFNYSLIKENRLQAWKVEDYKAYWLNIGRII